MKDNLFEKYLPLIFTFFILVLILTSILISDKIKERYTPTKGQLSNTKSPQKSVSEPPPVLNSEPKYLNVYNPPQTNNNFYNECSIQPEECKECIIYSPPQLIEFSPEQEELDIDYNIPVYLPIKIPLNTTKNNLTKSYSVYNHECKPPQGYHRYQSNTCKVSQDELPITMPDPNEGTIRPVMEKTLENMYYGSLPCHECEKLNLCQ